MSPLRRIKQEIKQIRTDADGITKSTGGQVQIFESDNDLFAFEAVMKGPEGSPYGDGIFSISIRISADYPLSPPKVWFKTKIWHPDVDFDNGRIGISILQRTEWSPAWTLQHILLAIWSLLNTPSLYEPANVQAAYEYMSNRLLFDTNAQFWTQVHAGTNEEAHNLMIDRLSQMGFPVRLVRPMLVRTNWDENVAVTELLELIGQSSASAVFSEVPNSQNCCESVSSTSVSEQDSTSSWCFVQGVSRLDLSENEDHSNSSSGWVDVEP